jgi:hypothetical protein
MIVAARSPDRVADEYVERCSGCASLRGVQRRELDWLEEHGVTPTGPLVTIRERHWSTIVRVPTAVGDLYLKKCGAISAYEVPLVAALAGRWPDRMPEVVAADPERAWLLMTDAGDTLRIAGRARMAEAVGLYAELQVVEVAHVDDFVAMDVPHLPLSWLSEVGGAFIGGEHGGRVPELCAALDAFGLPESIQHDDLHDNNVFLRDDRLALYDWGDATVAHPLFSYMKAFEVARADGTDPAPLRDALLGPWTAYLPRPRLEAAIDLALPLSRISYALQLQRHVDLMPPADRLPYEEHRDEHLQLAREGIDRLV